MNPNVLKKLLLTIKNEPLTYFELDKSRQENKEIQKQFLIQEPKYLQTLLKNDWDDNFVTDIIKENPVAFYYLTDKQKGKRQFIGHLLYGINKCYKINFEQSLENYTEKTFSNLWEIFPQKFLSSQNFLVDFFTVSIYGSDSSQHFKNISHFDRELLLIPKNIHLILSKNPYSYFHLPPVVADDIQIIKSAAFHSHGNIYRYFPEELRHDYDFIKEISSVTRIHPLFLPKELRKIDSENLHTYLCSLEQYEKLEHSLEEKVDKHKKKKI